MSDTAPPQDATGSIAGRYGLIRPREQRQVAGVCAAVARVTDTVPLLWRVLVAVGVLFGGVGLVAYLLGWLLMPEEGDSGSPLEALLGRGRSGTSGAVTVLLAAATALLLIVTVEWTPIALAALAAVGYVMYRQRKPAAVSHGGPAPVGEPTTAAPSAGPGTAAPSAGTGPVVPPPDTGAVAPPTAPPGGTGPTAPPGGTGPTAPPGGTGPAAPPGDTGPTAPPGDTGPTARPGESGPAPSPEPAVDPEPDPGAVTVPVAAARSEQVTVPVAAARSEQVTVPVPPPESDRSADRAGTGEPASERETVEVAGDASPDRPGDAPTYDDPELLEVAERYRTGDAAVPVGPEWPEPPDEPEPPAPERRPRSALGRAAVFGIIAAIGLVGLLHLAGARFGFSAYVAAALAVTGAALVVGTWFGRARWLIWLGALLSVVLAVSAAVESVDVTADGDRTWRPATVAQIDSDYKINVGNGTLDLRQVNFTGHDVAVDLKVNSGNITVLLPPDVDVTGEAKVAYGNAVLLGDEVSATSETEHDFSDLGYDNTVGPGQLRLDVKVNLGNLELQR